MEIPDPGKPVWILAHYSDCQVNSDGEDARSRRTSLSMPFSRILKLGNCLEMKFRWQRIFLRTLGLRQAELSQVTLPDRVRIV